MFSYFGYGSLVNRETRPADEQAVSARLEGWRRVWNHRVNFADRNVDPGDAGGALGCTSLSVEPLADTIVEQGSKTTGAETPHMSGIDGVLVPISAEELAGLDARESGYQRLQLPPSYFIIPDESQRQKIQSEEIIMYQSLPANQRSADGQFPVLQSYIDCVMAGYLARYNLSGLKQMLWSTRGWDKPIMNDRHAPLYPRHITLDKKTTALFDDLILECRQGPVSN